MKVLKSDIEARIAKVRYVRIPDSTVTICHITLDNGFSVRGESACVDVKLFNEQLGREIAYTEAFDKVYPYLGFLLMESKFQEEQSRSFGKALKALKEGKAVNRKSNTQANTRLKLGDKGALRLEFIGGHTTVDALTADDLLAEDWIVVS